MEDAIQLVNRQGRIIAGIVAIGIEESDRTTAYRKTYKCVSAILNSTEWQRQANAQYLESFKSYKPEMAFRYCQSYGAGCEG